MDVNFKKVTKENREIVSSLRVFEAQKNYIETVEECLVEADQFYEWRPVAIYDGEKLVGFAMYGKLDDERVWLDRLLIDKNMQGHGYAKAAIKQLIRRINDEYEPAEIFLSVYEDNEAAIALYRKMGFSFNGERDTKGEKVMVYPMKK